MYNRYKMRIDQLFLRTKFFRISRQRISLNLTEYADIHENRKQIMKPRLNILVNTSYYKTNLNLI